LAALLTGSGRGSVQRPSRNVACHRSQPPTPPLRSVLPQTMRPPSGLTLPRTSEAGVDTTPMPSMPNSASTASAVALAPQSTLAMTKGNARCMGYSC
jgi:hypothetical protein